MAHEPLALLLGVGLGDRLSQHPVEVSRCHPIKHEVIDSGQRRSTEVEITLLLEVLISELLVAPSLAW